MKRKVIGLGKYTAVISLPGNSSENLAGEWDRCSIFLPKERQSTLGIIETVKETGECMKSIGWENL